MPKTEPKPLVAVNGAGKAHEGPRFVRCDLTAEQKVLLSQAAAELEDQDLLRWIDERVIAGHTLSVRSNEVGYQASLTGTREASGHLNVSLVARASTPLRSIYAVWYRDVLVLQGIWPATDLLNQLDF